MKTATIKSDSGNNGRIRVTISDNGDANILVVEGQRTASTQFCTLLGGGRCPNTRMAIAALFEAIELDNASK